MSFAKILYKDLRILRGCLTHKLNLGVNVERENSCSKFRILFRNVTDDSKLNIKKSISDKSRALIRQRDGIPEDYKLIYNVDKSFSFKALHCSILVNAFGVPTFLFALAAKHDFKLPIKMGNEILVNSKLQIFVLLSFITYIVISAAVLVSRFPLRIYFNKRSDDYIATYSNVLIPWKNTKIAFKKGAVSIIPEEQMWMIQFSHYKINGQKVIFIEENFERPIDLENMIDGNSKFRLESED